jgi:hypothetical protein
MPDADEGTTAINPVLIAPSNKNAFMLFAITLPSFLLAGLCFGWYGSTREIPVLLLGLVTFGMAYDFMSHIFGIYLGRHEKFLRWYSRINFWALCFGIPFTAFAGTFVMAELKPEGISAQLAEYYLTVLHISVAFGALFFFARYRKTTIEGAVEFVLDKKHTYTNAIFIARRIILAASLIIAMLVVVDAWDTKWFWWSVAFSGVLIASVPLHILHKQIPSMLSELITQGLAVYATWVVFVA